MSILLLLILKFQSKNLVDLKLDFMPLLQELAYENNG